MSYQVGSICYQTEAAALEAVAATATGTVAAKGSAIYRITAVREGSQVVYSGVELGGSGSFATSVAVDLQPCGLLDWPDALELSWQVAGVWLAALIVVMIRRGA